MKSTKDKLALVLAGGGVTGAVYEIGALRAIDDLLIDRTVNDFDIFVGTSAGALVASFIASGVSPEAMLQVINGTHPLAGTVERRHIFHLNWWDYLQWGLKLPPKLTHIWTNFLRHFNEMTMLDLAWSFTDALPAGLYDGLALARFVEQGLSHLGYSNDFNDLARELYIIATDLDSGQRAVFGPGYELPTISMAVAASSAMPMFYKPVQVGGHEYIDGGLRGTASIDLAIEQGATLVVCINPLVPFDNERQPVAPLGKDSPRLSDKGVQSIANQSLRILLHSGLHYHIKQVRRMHPEVDIILVEPGPKDYEMFSYNIMEYSTRLVVARHGFESVTLDLAKDYQEYKDILARHDIPISRRLVIEELNEIANSNNDPEVIRKVLEAATMTGAGTEPRRYRTPGCNRTRRDKPIYQLDRTLAELEQILDEIAQKP